MSYLKIFLILYTFSFALFAEDDVVKKPKKTIDFKAEQEMVVAEINEKRVEDQLIKNNPNLEACQKDTTIPVEDCLKGQIGSMSEDEIEKLSQKLELPSYDKKASKDSGTIRDYLTERIEFALRGRPKGKKGKELSFKELKFVDHSNYNKIYRSQIGKNLLLEVTNYCLTNFGVKNKPGVLASQCLIKPTDASCAASATGKPLIEIQTDSKGKYNIDNAIDITTDYSTDFWKEHAYEYRLCDKMEVSSKTQGAPGNTQTTGCATGTDALSTPVKTTDLITAIKEAEFKAGAVFLKAKVGFCTQTVVKNMCEKYRCNHVYTSESDMSGEKLKYCQTELGIKVGGSFPSRVGRADPPIYYQAAGTTGIIDVSGIKACGLVTRLKEYRRVIAALDETDKFYKANKNQARGLSIGNSKAFKGEYQGGKDKSEQSIEEITTISSQEFVEIALSDAKNLEELKGKCFQNGVLNRSEKECEALVKNELEDDTEENLNNEMTAETEVYLKRLEQIAENKDEDSINEYLKKHGLEKHIGSNLSPEQLKDLISDQYKAERASLKHNMMEKFNRLTKKAPINNQPTSASDAEILEIAQDTISNKENQNDRIETMVQYNNIITSYMEAGFDTNGDGKADGDKISLTYQRDIEMNKFKELSKDSDAAQTASDYEKYFDDQQGDTAASTANSSLSIDIDFIDGLLGNK
jgi:hypothetical protein